MSEDAIRESLRAMLREMTIKHAADMVGVSYVTATRVLAGLPVKAPSRAKLAAFFGVPETVFVEMNKAMGVDRPGAQVAS